MWPEADLCSWIGTPPASSTARQSPPARRASDDVHIEPGEAAASASASRAHCSRRRLVRRRPRAPTATQVGVRGPVICRATAKGKKTRENHLPTWMKTAPVCSAEAHVTTARTSTGAVSGSRKMISRVHVVRPVQRHSSVRALCSLYSRCNSTKHWRSTWPWRCLCEESVACQSSLTRARAKGRADVGHTSGCRRWCGRNATQSNPYRTDARASHEQHPQKESRHTERAERTPGRCERNTETVMQRSAATGLRSKCVPMQLCQLPITSCRARK